MRKGVGAGTRAPGFTVEVSEAFSPDLSSMGSLAPLTTVKPVNTSNLSLFVEPALCAEPKVTGEKISLGTPE